MTIELTDDDIKVLDELLRERVAVNECRCAYFQQNQQYGPATGAEWIRVYEAHSKHCRKLRSKLEGL